jgi:GMP synthase-like glutamine amidotransferase
MKTILIIDVNGEKDSLAENEFCDPVARIASAHGRVKVLHYMDEGLQKDIASCERAIICGTPLMENAYLRRMDRFSWISGFQKPLLGICAGMQIIGKAFGSAVVEKKEIGMTKVRTVSKNPLFSGSISAYSLHGLAVEPSPAFTVIAKSTCCVQAMKHREKPIYGILFHPEARNLSVIENFLKVTRT